MKIAVLVGTDGKLASIQEPGALQVYHKGNGQWKMVRSMDFSLPGLKGVPAMREYMKETLDFLQDCRILSGSSVNGLPFFELEKAGFTIWELDGTPLEVLDKIMTSETEIELNSPLEAYEIVKPEPKEISPGCYSLSLKAIQNCNGAVTSKQVLIPLLSNMPFQELEIICDHVPPWLEVKVMGGEVNGIIKKYRLRKPE